MRRALVLAVLGLAGAASAAEAAGPRASDFVQQVGAVGGGPAHAA
ncbi:MAG: hypothetical protein JWQ48_1132, partial [Conexibacter sp.]|nr:hypothetical protein [Conexibacter sp.]